MRGGVHGRGGGGVDRLLKMKIAQAGPHHAIPSLFAHSVPVYPCTLAASSSLAGPLVPSLFARSVLVYPYTFAAASSSMAFASIPFSARGLFV